MLLRVHTTLVELIARYWCWHNEIRMGQRVGVCEDPQKIENLCSRICGIYREWRKRRKMGECRWSATQLELRVGNWNSRMGRRDDWLPDSLASVAVGLQVLPAKPVVQSQIQNIPEVKRIANFSENNYSA